MKPYPLSLDGLPPPTTVRSRWWRFTERHLPRIVLYLMVAALVAAVLLPLMVVTVPSGFVGVLWRRFGNGRCLMRVSSEVRAFAAFCLGINCFYTI